MKRGSQLTLKINSLEFPSTGISECEGKKIYVKGAFPGQRAPISALPADTGMPSILQEGAAACAP